MNKAILRGNLGNNPELRFTSTGQPVCNFRMATNRVYGTKEGERRKETTWHRVVVWGKQAESCAEYLSKGRQVYVEGRLQTRSWEDRDGNKRWTTEVVAQTVQFLGGGRKQQQEEPEPPQNETPPDFSDDDLPY